MAKPPSRDIVKIIFTNMWNSLKPRKFRGNYMGDDYFGNKFYEIPADPSRGRRKTARWFEPKEKEDFDQEMSAEWEAWLRGRRPEPPTRDELVQNLAIMGMKKKNAARLESENATPRDEQLLDKERKGMGSFPSYNEYESIPGKDPTPKG